MRIDGVKLFLANPHLLIETLKNNILGGHTIFPTVFQIQWNLP